MARIRLARLRRGARALLSASVLSVATVHLAAAEVPSEPPPCNDEAALRTIRSQYDFSETVRESKAVVAELKDIRETRFGPPPELVNQYATDTTYVTASRFCEAIAVLSSGESDPLYWRMDHLKDGDGASINYDHCSKRHDTFQDGCADYH